MPGASGIFEEPMMITYHNNLKNWPASCKLNGTHLDSTQPNQRISCRYSLYQP